MFIIRMDISGNFGDIMYQYNKNMRDYNDNMRLYLDIIANRERVQAQNNYRNSNRNDYAYYYTQPVRPLNNIFSTLFPTVRRENTLQDVIVRPTQQQILDATEIISFDESVANNNTNCPITLEPFTNGERVCRIKHCSHLFKQGALNDWFRRNVRCPICRYDIRDYVNHESDPESEADAEADNNDNEYENNDYSEMVEELLNESIQRDNLHQNQRYPSTRNTFTSNLTTAIRGFINNELSNLPPSLNNVASELLYTFDIPISFDVSGNMRV
jgi:hypothetical protein